MNRKLSRTDHRIHRFDTLLRMLGPHVARTSRPSPATPEIRDEPLNEAERRHAAGVMRVNHTGEVCAQALYQGQGCSAQRPEVRDQLEQAAREELDHLAWCAERLAELHDRPSRLNPLFYAASFSLGAVAGAVGERVGLGLIAATEEQAGRLLEKHLVKLPPGDHRSRAVLRQLAVDEAHHAQLALEAGGLRFPAPIQAGMALMAKVMTRSVYKI